MVLLQFEPEWKFMEQFQHNDLHSVLSLDSLESSHPVSIPVSNPDEINQIFDDISYSKGNFTLTWNRIEDTVKTIYWEESL